VASSDDRKSAVDHLALKAARDWERQQWTLYAENLKAYRAAISIMANPKTSTERAEAKGAELSEPVPPRLIFAEPTIEALVKSLCHGLVMNTLVPVMGCCSLTWMCLPSGR